METPSSAQPKTETPAEELEQQPASAEISPRRRRTTPRPPRKTDADGPEQERPERSREPRELHELTKYKDMAIGELSAFARELGLKGNLRQARQDMVFQIGRSLLRAGHDIRGTGVLEIQQQGGSGFLRSQQNSFHSGADDIFVPNGQIRQFQLRTGDTVVGMLRQPRDKERYFSMAKIEQVNGDDPGQGKHKVLFENLTPLFPDQWLKMESGEEGLGNLSGRVIDLLAPVGLGQRGLIVSPPKAGKTVMLQNIAHAIERNNPEVVLIVLLIDERPEEVTEMRRSVRGDVIASTFDEPASRHLQVAEMVNGQAKRLVESGKDVVILLDSITRLARAYNTAQPASGKILTGGVDAYALEKPKRFFGAARNLEGGGSLTILATALVETGSKMDEVIYEEFKGTGNMELHLERRMSEKRVFPAINVRRSGTRREDLLIPDEILQPTWVLRKLLHTMEDLAATEFLLDRLKETKTNEEFFEAMRRT